MKLVDGQGNPLEFLEILSLAGTIIWFNGLQEAHDTNEEYIKRFSSIEDRLSRIENALIRIENKL